MLRSGDGNTVVPLVGVVVECHCIDSAVECKIIQSFISNTKGQLNDASYTFVAPDLATTFCSFKVSVEGVQFAAKVKEKITPAPSPRDGFSPPTPSSGGGFSGSASTSSSGLDNDALKIRIGNIPSEKQIEVNLNYVTELTSYEKDTLCLTLPAVLFGIAPLGDIAGKKQNQVDEIAPLIFKGVFEMSSPIIEISSASHPEAALAVEIGGNTVKGDEKKATVTYNAQVDKDFQLLIKTTIVNNPPQGGITLEQPEELTVLTTPNTLPVQSEKPNITAMLSCYCGGNTPNNSNNNTHRQISDIVIDWGGLRALQVPPKIAPILENDRLVVYAFIKEPLFDTKITVRGMRGGSGDVFTQIYDFRPASKTTGKMLQSITARKLIRLLESGKMSQQDILNSGVVLDSTWHNSLSSGTAQGKKSEVLPLSLKFGVLSKNTHFELATKKKTTTTAVMATPKTPNPQTSAPPAPLGKGGGVKRKPLKTFGFEEKKNLSEKMNALQPEKYPGLLNIIKEANPHINKDDPEIEIDLDAMDNITLFRIEQYVKSCLPTSRPVKKRKSQQEKPSPAVKRSKTSSHASSFSSASRTTPIGTPSTPTPMAISTPHTHTPTHSPSPPHSGTSAIVQQNSIPAQVSSPVPMVTQSTVPPNKFSNLTVATEYNDEESESDSDEPEKSLEECDKILKLLEKHQYAWPFLTPVDPDILNIPDYFDIVKHPMDLGTVRKNLKKYNSAKEFAIDVRLVFKNCITYNQPGSDIVIMANALSDIFEKQYAPTKQVSADAEKLQLLEAKLEEMQRTIQHLRSTIHK